MFRFPSPDRAIFVSKNILIYCLLSFLGCLWKLHRLRKLLHPLFEAMTPHYKIYFFVMVTEVILDPDITIWSSVPSKFKSFILFRFLYFATYGFTFEKERKMGNEMFYWRNLNINVTWRDMINLFIDPFSHLQSQYNERVNADSRRFWTILYFLTEIASHPSRLHLTANVKSYLWK